MKPSASSTPAASINAEAEPFISSSVLQNSNCGSALRFSPHRAHRAVQFDWLAHRYRLAIREFISANGIVRTAAAARCQYLPARSAAASHSSDVATPTELSRALVGDAIEHVNLYSDVR